MALENDPRENNCRHDTEAMAAFMELHLLEGARFSVGTGTGDN